MKNKYLSTQKILCFFSFLIFLTLLKSDFINFLAFAEGILPNLIFRFISLVSALILGCVFLGYGTWICSLFNFKFEERLYAQIIHFCFGFFACGIFFYLLGLTGFLHKNIILVAMAIGVFGFVVSFKSKDFFHFKFREIQSLSAFWKTLFYGFFVFFLIRIGGALTYKSFGDPLYYNLPVGQDYLSLGGFYWIEHAELYFQAGLADFNLIFLNALSENHLWLQFTAQSFYFLSSSIILITLLIFFFSHFIPQRYAWIFTFAFWGSITFRRILEYAKPDYLMGVLLIFILVLLWDISRGKEKKETENLSIAVFFICSMLINIKSTSVIYVPFVFSAFFIYLFFTKNLTIRGLFFATISVVLGTLNLLKNYLIFKNPVLPKMSEYFPSSYFDEGLSERTRNSFFGGSGSFFDYVRELVFILSENYAMVILFFFILFFGIYSRKNWLKSSLKNKKFFLILFGLIIFSFTVWTIIFQPRVPGRMIIGVIYAVTFSIYYLAAYLISTNEFSKKFLSYKTPAIILVFFTLINSGIDIDFYHARIALSAPSVHKEFVRPGNDEENLIEYLNSKNNPDLMLLTDGSIQNRIAAKFKIQFVRTYSSRTRFFFEQEETNNFEEKFKALNIDYIALEKEDIPKRFPLFAEDDSNLFRKERIFGDIILFSSREI